MDHIILRTRRGAAHLAFPLRTLQQESAWKRLMDETKIQLQEAEADQSTTKKDIQRAQAVLLEDLHEAGEFWQEFRYPRKPGPSKYHKLLVANFDLAQLNNAHTLRMRLRSAKECCDGQLPSTGQLP